MLNSATTEGYLLDTPVASWLWDGDNSHHAAARAKVEALGDAPFFVCAITVGEVSYGLGVSPAIDPARHALVRKNLIDFEVLSIDRHTADVYGQIRATLFAKYSPRDSRGRMRMKAPEDLIEATTGKTLGIQENDLWIVSVAVQYDLRLVTGDQAGGMQRVLAAANYLHRAEFWAM